MTRTKLSNLYGLSLRLHYDEDSGLIELRRADNQKTVARVATLYDPEGNHFVDDDGGLIAN